MESLRLNNVAFCGENPNIALYEPGGSRVTAAASYWYATYSPHGEGHALMLYLDEANAAASGQSGNFALYSDNPALARYLNDSFNQHLVEWKDLKTGGAPVQPARFVKESDTRQFYRVACHSDQTHIDLLWHDIRYVDFRTFPDLEGGGFGTAGDEHYHVANVIFLCGAGSIIVNQHLASGQPQTRTRPDGRFSTSVFVALSETWIKVV